LPLKVTIAWISVQPPAVGFASVVKSVMTSGLAPGVGFPPGLVGGVGAGASVEQDQ
jgi:hypothetical protein